MLTNPEKHSTSDCRGCFSALLRRPIVRVVALTAAVIQGVGCYATGRVPLPSPISITDPMAVYWNDRQLTLHDTRLEGDSMLVGYTKELAPETVEHRIPVGELYQFERRVHAGYTVFGVMSILAFGALWAWSITCSGEPDGYIC